MLFSRGRFTSKSNTDNLDEKERKPKVLIVGAGIGGLMLALLLRKGGVDFELFERAKEVVPLGSGLTMGSNVTPLFKQLGIFEEFEAIGKHGIHAKLLKEDLSTDILVDFSERQKMCGAKEYIVPRPELYNLLLDQVPQANIHMNKKMVSFHQGPEEVAIHCADGSSYSGDILVGADGAYSSVRQNLFKKLKAEGRLPTVDDKPMPFHCICILGQTVPLDPEDFPHLQLPRTEFNSVLANDQGYTRVTITTKNNTICWVNILFLDKSMSKSDELFCGSEWGPDATEAMCAQVRDFTVPGGKDGHILTMGELIDRTPKHLISKVMLEEKVFKTWFNQRTVLLGDACHKLNPAGGQGALTAVHDAVALANWISTLRSTSIPSLERVFREYRNERQPIAKRALLNSQFLCLIGGKSFKAKVLRMIFKRLPKWIWKRFLIDFSNARPQASFLPLQADEGSIPPMYQPSLYKTLPLLQQNQHLRRTQHASRHAK